MENGNTWLLLRILEVPDLTLIKYNSAGLRGIDSLLEFHKEFLRQWSQKGIITEVSIHLFYNYDPINKNGNRMGVYIGFYGSEVALANALPLIKSSSLFKMYHFAVVKSENFIFTEQQLGDIGFELLAQSVENTQESNVQFGEWQRLNECSYDKCCMLSKKEVLIEGMSSDSEDSYYTVSGWEPNEGGRLQQLYKLLQAFNESMLLRIDIYPVDWNEKIRKAFKKPVERLKNKQMERMGLATSKDYSLDTILKSYDEIVKNLDGTPHFRVNAFVFGPLLKNGQQCDDVEMTLATLAAEALSKGDYAITNITQVGEVYNTFSFLHNQIERIQAVSDNNKVIKLLKKSKAGYELLDRRCENNVLRFLPTVFTLEELEPMFRLPVLNESDNVEIRKETTPELVSEKESLLLGLDDNGYEVNFPLKILAKHALIAGVPGSGKTNMMHHLTSTLWLKHRIPFLIFEPAKQEYRALANQEGMEELYIFSPNAEMTFPLHINPFEFPKGLMLAEHIRHLGAVFEGAFPLEPPMPFILDTAIEAVYRELGWKPETVYTDAIKFKFPSMTMLYQRLEKEISKTTYSDEVSGNLKSALQVRIGSLLRREMGEIFDVPKSTFSPEEWLVKPAVIELEAMGTGPANFTMLLLCTLIRESLKVNPYYEKDHARHVIFIEEAHNLIGPEAQPRAGSEADPKQAATAFLVKMLAEVRALKEAIVIADQLPTVLAKEVIKNTGLKIGLRITSSDDRGLLCSTMAASEMQMEAMSTFSVGRALVSYEGLQKPFIMQMHEWLGEGDDAYIKDTELRKCVSEPKRDEQLYNLIMNRTSYNEIAKTSFLIELSKVYARQEDYIKKISLSSNYFIKLKEKEDTIEALKKEIENKILQLREMVLTDYDTGLEKMKFDFEHLEDDFIKYKQSHHFKDSYILCIEGLELINEIAERKSHWKKLGLEKFSKPGQKDYRKVIRQVQAVYLKAVEAQFICAKDYFIEKSVSDIESAIIKGKKKYF